MTDFFSVKRRDLYVESIDCCDCCDCIVKVVGCGTLFACWIEFTGKFAAMFEASHTAVTYLEKPPLLGLSALDIPNVPVPIKMNQNKFMSISL